MAEPVLSVRGLTTELSTPRGEILACRDVSFDLYPGETLGIVGESGSGKTITVLSILGLLPARTGRIVAGSVTFEGMDLTAVPARTLRRLRGSDLGMVFQDPLTSLNPVVTVGSQLMEAINAHHPDIARRAARARGIELLDLVGVPNAEVRMGQFPHEFSGGMRQRAMIAMAIANEPKVLIADEPTTALDVTIQAQVLEVLQVAQRETAAALILITHDLGVIAEMANRVLVMYAGRIVERGPVRNVFHEPRHPYTVGLSTSRPSLDEHAERLVPIQGNPPSGLSVPSGCAFHPRCSLSDGRQRCRDEVPRLQEVGADHQSACHFVGEIESWTQRLEDT